MKTVIVDNGVFQQAIKTTKYSDDDFVGIVLNDPSRSYFIEAYKGWYKEVDTEGVPIELHKRFLKDKTPTVSSSSVELMKTIKAKPAVERETRLDKALAVLSKLIVFCKPYVAKIKDWIIYGK